MTTAFKTGSSGRAQADGTIINVTRWSAAEGADWHETTHSGSGGYKESIAGAKQITGRFEGNWDANAEPTADPPNLQAGVELSNLLLYIESGGAYVNMPLAGIDSFEVTSEVNGVISFVCAFHSNGTYSWPS